MLRWFVGLLVKTGFVLLFNAFGWITLMSGDRVVAEVTWTSLGLAGLVALVFMVFTLIFWRVWANIVAMFLSAPLAMGLLILVTLLVLPLLGWALLSLTAALMSSTLVLHGFWLTLLCGFLLLIGIPTVRISASTTRR